MSIQGWFPSGLTALISLKSKGLKSILHYHSSLALSLFYGQALTSIHDWKKTIVWLCGSWLVKWCLCFESLLLWWAQSVLRAYLMGLRRVRHDWATEMNWTELIRSGSPRIISLSSSQMTWDLNHIWKISVSFNNWERTCVHSGTTLELQSPNTCLKLFSGHSFCLFHKAHAP